MKKPAILPQHEIFYLESLLYCTSTATRGALDVRDALEYGSLHDPSTPDWQESARVIMDGVHTIVFQAAGLSRYFWPARAKELHLARAACLRDGLGIEDSSPLKNRDLRNLLEHFDERLDTFCEQFNAGVILPTYVGPEGADPSFADSLVQGVLQ